MYGASKWIAFLIGILGIAVCVLEVIEGNPFRSYIPLVLLTIMSFARSIYYFVKDASYKKIKHDK